jgi:hypothetical protein
MSSTYSSNLRVELIGSGDQAGTWGTTTDNNFAYLFDTAIAGAISVTIAGTPQALTAINGPTSTTAANQAVFATLKLVSAAAPFTLYAPPAAKQYIVWNATSHVATIGNATSLGGTTSTGGATITLAAGEKAQIWSDNTNFYKVDVVTTFSGGTTGLTPSTATGGAVTLAGTLAVANGGTGVTTSTGSGNNVLSTSPTLVTPILGTPQSGNLANCTFPTLNQNTTGSSARIANSGGWSVTPSGGTLYFDYNGTNVGSLDSSGNFTVIGNVTAYGTV